MTDDIVAFARARLDEDESDAQDASSRSADWERAETPPARWGRDEPAPEILSGGRLYMTFEEDKGAPLAVDHVLRHDPARVLRGVEAKRRILDDLDAAASELEHAIVRARTTNGRGDELGERDDRERVIRKRVKYATLGRVVEDLIAEWSTHPEYRTEWPR